jgi:hypothetical protein
MLGLAPPLTRSRPASRIDSSVRASESQQVRCYSKIGVTAREATLLDKGAPQVSSFTQ